MGGSKDQTVTQSSEPWTGVKPYLQKGYASLQKQWDKGPPGYYPRNTLAPMSGYTRGALDSLAGRASQGSPLTDAAQGQLTSTLRGDYLAAGNPYFQGAMNAATRPIIDTYSKQIVPGLDSQFSSAGRYGSGAHAQASSDAANNLMTQVGDISSQMAYQNYGDERQNQIRGMLFAPELANQDYRDIEMLGKAGEGYDAYNQSLIDANIARWNYNQNKHWDRTTDFLGTLVGAPGGQSSTTQPVQRPNIFTGTLGGAATGFGIGGVPGAVIGGGIGLLGSLFN